MTISRQLILTLAIAMLALIGVASLGLWQLGQAQERMVYMQDNTMPSLKDLGMARDAAYAVRGNIFKHVLLTDSASMVAQEAKLADAFKQFDVAMNRYLTTDVSDDTDKQMTLTDQALMVKVTDVVNRILPLSRENQTEKARDLILGDLTTSLNDLFKALDDHLAYNYKLTDQLFAENASAHQRSFIWIVILIVVVLLIVLAMSIQVYRMINKGLSGIGQTLSEVSQKLDFTQRAKVLRRDEIGATAEAFNHLLGTLQDNMRTLSQKANDVAGSAQTLSQTANQVSAAAGAQSTAAASMAATVEEMTVSINHVAEQAKETQAGSEEAGQLVNEGSRIIGQTIGDIHEISTAVKASATSIHELETYSTQVSSVIKVIRDIADQTNLLALNAAIEAARAGEQGRGFAVVADEVRKLAERTANSTQEISSTIETMMARAQHATEQMKSAEELVDTGVLRADNADQAIKKIGENAATATRSIHEISGAIREQGVASNNIAIQVEKTAQMSEESSAAAKQTADSAERLDQLAREQLSTLARYRF